MNAIRRFNPVLAAVLVVTSVQAAFADETVTFDDGPLGWSISGCSNVVIDGGNPGANLTCIVDDVFGAEIRSSTDQAFVGDLTRYGAVTISIDVKINSIAIEIVLGEVGSGTVGRLREALQGLAGGLDVTPRQRQFHG